MRESGKRNEEAAGNLLAPAVEKTRARMREAFDEIGKALNARPPHSPTPVHVLTVSGAAGAKANS